MSKVRIELDSDGIQALLKSEELAEVCEQKAIYMTRVTGMKYEADVFVGWYRVNAGGYSKARAYQDGGLADD